MPRYLLPQGSDMQSLEIHTFGDDSEEAYAVVVYSRCVMRDGSVIVRHVKAATKLAPLRTLSVPKLELNAALLGARLTRFVVASLSHPVTRRVLWTESSTTRNWIRATTSMYQPFVSHRIEEIQTLTEPHECTRTRKTQPCCAVAEEIRPTRTYVTRSQPYDWDTVQIQSEELRKWLKAEKECLGIVKQSQSETFSQEIEQLQEGKPLRSTSSLLPLTPFLDDDVFYAREAGPAARRYHTITYTRPFCRESIPLHRRWPEHSTTICITRGPISC